MVLVIIGRRPWIWLVTTSTGMPVGADAGMAGDFPDANRRRGGVPFGGHLDATTHTFSPRPVSIGFWQSCGRCCTLAGSSHDRAQRPVPVHGIFSITPITVNGTPEIATTSRLVPL